MALAWAMAWPRPAGPGLPAGGRVVEAARTARRRRVAVARGVADGGGDDEEEDPVGRFLAERSERRYRQILERYSEVEEGAEDEVLAKLLEELRTEGALDAMQERQDRALRVLQGLDEDEDEEDAQPERSASAKVADVVYDGDEDDYEDDYDRERYRERPKRTRRRDGSSRAARTRDWLEGVERRLSSNLRDGESEDAYGQDIAQKTGWAFVTLLGLYFGLQLLVSFIAFFANFTFSFFAIFLLSAGIFVFFYVIRF